MNAAHDVLGLASALARLHNAALRANDRPQLANAMADARAALAAVQSASSVRAYFVATGRQPDSLPEALMVLAMLRAELVEARTRAALAREEADKTAAGVEAKQARRELAESRKRARVKYERLAQKHAEMVERYDAARAELAAARAELAELRSGKCSGSSIEAATAASRVDDIGNLWKRGSR